MWTQAGSPGEAQKPLSREQRDHIWAVRVLGGRGEGKGRRPNLRPGRFPLGRSHQRPTIEKGGDTKSGDVKVGRRAEAEQSVVLA